MKLPPLLDLQSIAEYRDHFQSVFVRSVFYDRHRHRVHFSVGRFDHAFYESSRRDGNKDDFSLIRARRIDWIAGTLTAPTASWYEGWNNRTRQQDATRAAVVAYEEFVVVLAYRLRRQKQLVANFVTCFNADNSIGKIRKSPLWSACQNALEARGGR